MIQTVADLLVRAKSAIDLGIIYKLGAGGMIPTAATPANIEGKCDCSGFVCWALGLKRMTDNIFYVKFNGDGHYGWINTDAMYKDAQSPTGFFTEISEPRVGCLVVFPGGKLRKVGHVGLVSAVAKGQATKVIHCSSSNYKNTKDAIQETPPTVFATSDAIFIWYDGVGS